MRFILKNRQEIVIIEKKDYEHIVLSIIPEQATPISAFGFLSFMLRSEYENNLIIFIISLSLRLKLSTKLHPESEIC